MTQKNNNKKVNLDEMSKDSGESTLMGAPKYQLPIVRLHGKDGTFLKITKDKNGQTQTKDLGATIQGTTLRFRRILSCFISEEVSLFTNEHDSSNDVITLFQSESSKDGKRSTMPTAEGPAKTIKENEPRLKMIQIVYFLMNKEIVKLQIKGSSLKNFYEFRQEVKKKEGKHFFQFLLEIKKEQVKGKLGSYYTMNFKIKEELKDLKLVAKKIAEVKENLEVVEEHYKSRAGKEDGQIVAEAIEKDFKDGGKKEEEKDDDEIDVKDIPFG